ncbi:hypothetical protein Vadar_019754 [Vaccinium darrowii]|nr:hypothetical protein Vadar_019754 [Vaccinium darrowii]
MEEEQSSATASLKNKLKQTPCLSNCFPNNNNDKTLGSDDCMWLSKIRNKCCDLINCINCHRQRCLSTDFGYWLSYALNFDDDGFNEISLQGVCGCRLKRWQRQELLARRSR